MNPASSSQSKNDKVIASMFYDSVPSSACNAPPVEGTYRKVAFRIMPFLMLCYITAYLDRINIGFAKLRMLNDLGLTDTAYGLGAGLFFIGYLLFEVPRRC